MGRASTLLGGIAKCPCGAPVVAAVSRGTKIYRCDPRRQHPYTVIKKFGLETEAPIPASSPTHIAQGRETIDDYITDLSILGHGQRDLWKQAFKEARLETRRAIIADRTRDWSPSDWATAFHLTRRHEIRIRLLQLHEQAGDANLSEVAKNEWNSLTTELGPVIHGSGRWHREPPPPPGTGDHIG